jgi:hypothetical protein
VSPSSQKNLSMSPDRSVFIATPSPLRRTSNAEAVQSEDILQESQEMQDFEKNENGTLFRHFYSLITRH